MAHTLPKLDVMRGVAAAAALAGAVCVLYAPVVGYGFVSFDDPEYVTENRHVTSGPTLGSIAWAFTSGHAANWHPATWLSHMIDWQLFGAWAGGHHLTSVALHAAAAATLLWVLYRMTGALGRSAVVAALFALHPLRVESVAWIAERKDVLSTLGWMLTLWAYVRYVERPAATRWVLVAAGFVFALLAKPMAVTLPFALLLLDWWPLRRMENPSPRTIAALVREKVPLFVASALAAAVTYAAQMRAGAVASLEGMSLAARAVNASLAYVGYLRKTILPVDLAVFYPTPETLSLVAGVAALALLVALSAVAVRTRRERPYLLVGWLWYLGTLVPVIGLVRAGEQAMADRFTYVPSIGLFMAAAWGIADVLRRPAAAAVAATTAVVLCAAATAAQLPTWRDNHALYERALRVTRDNCLAHMNLGLQLRAEGASEVALEHLRRAVEVCPKSAKTHVNLGVVLAAADRVDEAIVHYQTAARLEPHLATPHFDMGVALAEQGRLGDAVAAYREAIRLDPEHAKSYTGLGLALVQQGRFDEAISQYRTALRLAPELVEAHNNLALALDHLGMWEDALVEYEAAIRLAPDDARLRYNLATVLREHGRPRDAIGHYRAALGLAPDLVEAWAGLGDALRATGDATAALQAYREAARRRPESPELAARIAELETASGGALR